MIDKNYVVITSTIISVLALMSSTPSILAQNQNESQEINNKTVDTMTISQLNINELGGEEQHSKVFLACMSSKCSNSSYRCY